MPAQSVDDWSLPIEASGPDLERDRVRAKLQQQMFGVASAPTSVGRFQLVERLGAGSAGVVYRAHDPKLNRPVALKLLHPIHYETQRYTDRLVREAQAMAQLSHPNVVGVHDVGTHEGQLFIAMEFVAGSTLRQWLSDQQPDWRRALQVLIGAGRGLEAAHQRGFAHRDFKPENTLIDTQGRARIVDFGLVRATSDAAVEPGAAGPHTQAALGKPMTQIGSLVGTPLYMSPEQLLGRVADARSDQFGFCATLFEALHGNRPYQGDTLGDLVMAVSSGRVSAPERNPGVPTVVHEALLRGLAPDPALRYPSMTELLADLERGLAPPRRTGRWALIIGGAALAVAALGVAGWFALSATLGEPTAGGADSGRDAPEAKKVRELYENQQYGECVRHARKAQQNLYVVTIWYSCALGNSDYREAERVCAVWRKNFEHPAPPDSCRPGRLRLYEARSNGKHRECLRIAEGMKPTMDMLDIRLSCASSAKDWKAYGRACDLMAQKFPENANTATCRKLLEVHKDD